MAKIAPFGRYRAFDADGNPLAAGKLYTYEAGTSTPKTTYTDKDAGSANTNPVVLDADGYADVWLDTGGYKFVLKDSNDALLWEKDDIDGGSAGGYASAVISKSSGFAVTINEQNNVIICTAALTASLLPAATAGDGFAVVFINTSSGNVTIDPDGAETINGASNLVLNAGSSVSIHCNGSEWYATTVVPADGSITEAKLSFAVTGMVVPYAGSSAPTGWLLCYGQTVSRTTYADLFGVVGTTYNTGGEAGTDFRLPDLRGRSVFGKDNMGGSTASRITAGNSGITGTTLGAAGGDERLHSHTHTNTLTDPGHQHYLQGNATATNVASVAGGNSAGTNINNAVTMSATTGITITNASSGSGSSQNVPPAIILNYLIKT